MPAEDNAATNCGRLLKGQDEPPPESQSMNSRYNMKRIVITTFAIVAASVLSVSAADAKAIYTKECLKCHGADGKGATKMGKKLGARDYTDPKVQASVPDDVAFKAIKEGLKDKAGKTLMQPSPELSDADIKGLIAYMRTFKK